MKKKTAWYVVIGCVVVLAACMGFAVVMSQRDAHHMNEHGTHVTARVIDKFMTDKRVAGAIQHDYWFKVEFNLDGSAMGETLRNQGVDQIYDRTNIGSEVRIVFAPDRGAMLEDWATGKLSSF